MKMSREKEKQGEGYRDQRRGRAGNTEERRGKEKELESREERGMMGLLYKHATHKVNCFSIIMPVYLLNPKEFLDSTIFCD